MTPRELAELLARSESTYCDVFAEAVTRAQRATEQMLAGPPCDTWDRITLGGVAVINPNPTVTPKDPTIQIEMVLVRGEYRTTGIISAEELADLERDHDSGDIRPDDALRIIRTGQRR